MTEEETVKVIREGIEKCIVQTKNTRPELTREQVECLLNKTNLQVFERLLNKTKIQIVNQVLTIPDITSEQFSFVVDAYTQQAKELLDKYYPKAKE